MYQFYLDGELLPVAPEKLTVKIGNQNKTLTLINGEEVGILKRPGLSKITFSALLPAAPYPFAQYLSGFQNPVHFLDKLEALKNGLKPFLFQVVRPQGWAQSSFTVSLEDYSLTEDAERYGRDVYVDITLLQHRGFVTKTITFKQEKDQTTATVKQEDRPTTGKTTEETYTVKAGDCLWNIAKKYLGSGTRYPEIIKLNLDTLDADAKKHGKASSSNGYWLFAGTVLKLPAK